MSVDGLWEYDHRRGHPFETSAYYFGFGCQGLPGTDGSALRRVSSSVRDEFDDVFLTKCSFRFNDSKSLTEFFNRLTKSQLSRLFSIDIGICTLYKVAGWLDIMGLLPPALKELRFRIYPIQTSQVFSGEQRDREGWDILNSVVRTATQSAPGARISITSATQNEPLNATHQTFADRILWSLKPQGDALQ